MTTDVLVLDAEQRSALAAVRSLGKHGDYRVYTASWEPHALAGSSRHSYMHLTYPDPCVAPVAFLDWCDRTLQNHAFRLVLPMTEVTTDLLTRHCERWPNVTLPFADISTIDAVANKAALHQRAETLGVPIPRTSYPASASELLARAGALVYPAVLKPCRSRIWLGDRWLTASVKIVHSQEELETALQDEVFANHPFLLQECVPGLGQGVFALYDRGKPVAFFAHKRLRERPPWGGVSTLSESTMPDPKLMALARQLLDDARWHGVAMVEFKVAPDGTPYLMEINTRFWGSLQLAIDAGVDFPALLLDLADGRPVPQPIIKAGLRLRWLLGDLDHLYLTLRSPRYSLGNKLSTIIALLTPDFSGRTRHEINRWDDLRPAWRELKKYLGRG